MKSTQRKPIRYSVCALVIGLASFGPPCLAQSGNSYQENPKVDADTVLYAAFDSPDLEARTLNPVAPVGQKGVQCEMGRLGKAANFSTENQSFLVYKPELEWDSGEGTIMFWVKLNWEPISNASGTRTILDIAADGEAKNRLRMTLYQNKDEGLGAVLFLSLMDSTGKAVAYGADIARELKWNKGEWHRVVVSFASGKGILFCIDGQMYGLGKVDEMWQMNLTKATITLGAPFYAGQPGRNDVRLDGWLDELFITRKAILPVK